MFLVLAYDISDDARRTRLADELENWGRRAQKSVFEFELDDRRFEMLLDRVREMTTVEDQVRVYRLCRNCVEGSVVVRGVGFATDPDYYQV
ncbi:MAG TPA: CRISPR-associated endonuclease Cas2 [Blastocatellia bacterium]|nr:CRISPR-associated endonuclease Cas2 [Blastocatellia bacterium]